MTLLVEGKILTISELQTNFNSEGKPRHLLYIKVRQTHERKTSGGSTIHDGCTLYDIEFRGALARRVSERLKPRDPVLVGVFDVHTRVEYFDDMPEAVLKATGAAIGLQV